MVPSSNIHKISGYTLNKIVSNKIDGFTIMYTQVSTQSDLQKEHRNPLLPFKFKYRNTLRLLILIQQFYYSIYLSIYAHMRAQHIIIILTRKYQYSNLTRRRRGIGGYMPQQNH